MSVATSIYTHLDTVMLGFMHTNTELGYYNAAVKLKSILVSLITSMGTVLLPRLSYYYEMGKKEEFMRMISKALNFVMLLALPLSVYFIAFAEESILLLSGESFPGCGDCDETDRSDNSVYRFDECFGNSGNGSDRKGDKCFDFCSSRSSG